MNRTNFFATCTPHDPPLSSLVGLTDWQRFFLSEIGVANRDGRLRSPRPHEMDRWVRMHPRDAGRSLIAQIEIFNGRDPWWPRPESYYAAEDAEKAVYR